MSVRKVSQIVLPNIIYRDPDEFITGRANDNRYSIMNLRDVLYKVALSYKHQDIPTNISEFVYENIVKEMCSGQQSVIFRDENFSDKTAKVAFLTKIKHWIEKDHGLTCSINDDILVIYWDKLADLIAQDF